MRSTASLDRLASPDRLASLDRLVSLRPSARAMTVIVVMGVSGSGKTTVGRMLASELDWPFYEGDDFHPAQNVQKMRAGRCLDDADRAPWLAALERLITDLTAAGRSAVVSCSALKQRYREQLAVDDRVRFVYLKAESELLRQRLEARAKHFMPADLLDSQFDALEEPGPEVLTVWVDVPPTEVVARILARLAI